MKNKKAFLILFFVITVFAGCKKVKNNEADATIYVKQYKTGTPIANAKILITRGRPGSGIGSSIVDSLFTDSNGKASYKKTLDEDYMYYAEAYKEKYFDTHNQQVSVSLGEKDFKTTIYMYAHSYVKLHVKNVSPFNQYDSLESSIFCGNNTFIQGFTIDTVFLVCDNDYKFLGDFDNYGFNYTVTKNSIANTSIIYFIPPL